MLSREYMQNHLERVKCYGVTPMDIINSLYKDVERYDREITRMALANNTNNKLYDEYHELRETSLQSINSWKTML